MRCSNILVFCMHDSSFPYRSSLGPVSEGQVCQQLMAMRTMSDLDELVRLAPSLMAFRGRVTVPCIDARHFSLLLDA